ncbi:MAG: Abortive infection protein [Candidatus Wolfebacteria bacterium GW2011_GWC2_39_22]|uniref:Abortive infection protein n=1 Tax=Candidatus Wolfebacteria bacterium GW2011_GWC2_39_22 TaxID=1619013 RepID=A0A0G0N9K2_9BACT|nr:MAG: Abortive infection protein [Candidatus Wolfebacteria bacterium GW2011_GWC2_39_22]HBI25276.1 hypothetical protein [Candidatus Wolfebacteria bacterium]
MKKGMTLSILPRRTMSWEEFVAMTPRNSVALDGVVSGGPRFDERTMHANFDHHDGVNRDATMSTCMQAYMAIKGGLMESFRENGMPCLNAFINDTDQDTAMAVWLLNNYKLFEGVQSLPHINRLLDLTNKWDITGGAYPINLDEEIVRQHCWIFEPYTDLRKTGKLSQADENMLRDNIEAVMKRLDMLLMGQAGGKTLDTRHEILYDSPIFKIVNEIGGNEARYHLYGKGMNAFISVVAQRTDGRHVYTIGRRSQYIPFPIQALYDDFNLAEGLTRVNGWSGSTIIGGSSREMGSGLSWQELVEIVKARLALD